MVAVLGLWGRLQGQIRVSVNECPETWIGFRIGNFPWEPSENHTHENDGYAPDVRLSWIIRLVDKNLWGEIWIATDDASSRSMCFARVMEYGSSAEINELDNIVRSHDAIIKFEVTMSKAHFV